MNEVKLSPFLRSSLALGSSTVGRLVFGVAKSKVAALVLGSEGVGLLGLLSQLELLGSSLASLTMANGIARRVSLDRTKPDDAGRTLGVETSIWIVGALCAGFLVLGSLGALYAVKFLPAWEGKGALLLPLLIAVPVHSVISSVIVGIYFGHEKVRQYSAGSLVGGAVELALFLLFVKPFGVEGALWASTAGFVAWLAYALRGLLREPGVLPSGVPRFDRAVARELVEAGLVITVAGAMTYGSSVVIRGFFLERLGANEAGIYHVGVVFSSLYMPLLTNGIWARLHPRASASFTSEETHHDWAESLLFGALFGSAIQAGLIFFSSLAILVLYSGEFLPATHLMPAQMLGDFFFVLAQPTLAVLLARARHKLYLATWMAYYLAFSVLTVLLLPYFGLKAAPVAYLISGAGLFGVCYLYYLRHVPSWGRAMRISAVIGLGLAVVAFAASAGGLHWAAKAAILAVWCCMVCVSYFRLRHRLLA